MLIVVTGSSGQVVSALAELAPAARVEVVRLGRPALDLAQLTTIAPAIHAARPDIVVNAAAYTAVDQAEHEAGIAHLVNAVGAGAVAAAARDIGVPVVHLSTDYVFAGDLDRPYTEDDPVDPLGDYGRTKLAGEVAVREANMDHAVLRTAWVYSPFGKNFVKTMLRLGSERDEVRVVADQYGSPTAAHDVAEGVIRVCRNLLGSPGDADLRGVFHMTGAGYTTWAGLAERVFAASAAAGGAWARVEHIPASAFPTPAARPQNSRLDCSRLEQVHGVSLPAWGPSVDACVRRLVEEARSRTERS